MYFPYMGKQSELYTMVIPPVSFSHIKTMVRPMYYSQTTQGYNKGKAMKFYIREFQFRHTNLSLLYFLMGKNNNSVQ